MPRGKSPARSSAVNSERAPLTTSSSSSSLNSLSSNSRWQPSPEITKNRAQHWSGPIFAQGRHLKDKFHRSLSVRGVNLCGNSKLPTSPPGSTHLSEGFWHHRDVSFIGRPFPLNEADEHFSRLRSWGLTFVRLLVPWEALEHEGPGIYDEDFIHYLTLILEKATQYGIQCFIDPHQDTWSRYSGGSGAPGWTFEVAGLDITKFKTTGAAHVHQLEVSETEEANAALWPTNYNKLASATMFTLFFGGNVFAPKATFKGQSIQDFLQEKFIQCYQYLASRLKKYDAVVGYEVINEPHCGYIGLQSIYRFDPNTSLILGDSPSALQSFALGNGMTQEIEFWVKSWPRPSRKGGNKILNKEKDSVWLNNQECIWKRHGVWTVDDKGDPMALIPDYFTRHPQTKKPINFNQDFYLPFVKKYANAIHEIDTSALIFFEPIPNEDPPIFSDQDRVDNLVYAPHWYDLKTMFTKSFYGIVTHDVQGLSRGTKNVLSATYFGLTGANKNYLHQITNISQTGLSLVGSTPCLIGECGIPMDINEKRSFETGDYYHHNNFLDAVINAMEANQLNFTLWNYNPNNDNIYGDHWNGEDFSIYSPKPSPNHSRSASLNSSFALPKRTKSKEIPHQILEEKLSESPSKTSPTTTPTTPFEITNAYFDVEGDRLHHHHEGGRALDAIMRVYAAKTPGEPILTRFDLRRLSFRLEFLTEKDSSNGTKKGAKVKDSKAFITEIFIPNYHYGNIEGIQIQVSDGDWIYDREKQTLFWKYDPQYEHSGTPFSSLYSLFSASPKQVKSQDTLTTSYSKRALSDTQVLHVITITVPENELPVKPTSSVQIGGGVIMAVGVVCLGFLFGMLKQHLFTN